MAAIPLLAGGALLAGSLMSAGSERSKRRAAEEKAAAEAARQREFNQERFTNFQDALAALGESTGPGARDEAADMRTALYEQNAARPAQVVQGPQAAGGDSGSRMFSNLMAESRGEADADVMQRGERRARLIAPQQTMRDARLSMRPMQSRDRRIRDAMRVSGSLAPGEMQSAYEDTGNWLALGGNALSTLGSFGMYNAGAGGGLSNLF